MQPTIWVNPVRIKIVDVGWLQTKLQAMLEAGVAPSSVVFKESVSLSNMDQPDAVVFVCYDGETALIATHDEGEYVIIGTANLEDARLILDYLVRYIPGMNILDLRREQ